MGQRDPNTALVRGAMQTVSVLYENYNYIANEVFPIIRGLSPLTKVTKLYKGPWFKNSAAVRAPGTPAKKIYFNITSQNLSTQNYAVASPVTDEEVRNANTPGALLVDPRAKTVKLLNNAIALKREIDVAAVVKATDWNGIGVGGEDADGGWGHAVAGSDTFVADAKKVRAKFHSVGSPPPNRLLLDFYAHQALQSAPALLTTLYPQGFNSQTQFVGLDSLAMFAQVKKVIVAPAIYDDSEEIQLGTDANFNAVDIWASPGGNTKGFAFFYYAPDAPAKEEPSAGYQYNINQANGSFTMMQEWRDTAIHSNMMDIQQEYDIAAVALDCGYAFQDTATT